MSDNGQPLLLTHAQSAALCGMSLASWHRRLAAGQVGPRAIRVGGSSMVRFSRPALEDWIARGCPSRDEYDGLLRTAERRA
jgi:predicted DNA-binding transcriptional regulator AlpA